MIDFAESTQFIIYSEFSKQPSFLPEYAKWGRSEGTEGFAIGGEQVINPSLYPWHVAIFVQGKYGGGGSLISESFVLTGEIHSYKARP